MDDWSKALFEAMEATAQDMERWLNHLSDQARVNLETLAQQSEAWADQVERNLSEDLNHWLEEVDQSLEPLERAIAPEVEAFTNQMNAVIEPMVNQLTTALDEWFTQVSTPLSQTVDPIMQDHHACVGCRNYHGQAYGGNLLVCGMHPYGPEQDQCPDWESTWNSPIQ